MGLASVSLTVFSGRQYADNVSFNGPLGVKLVLGAKDNGAAQMFFEDDLAAAAEAALAGWLLPFNNEISFVFDVGVISI